MKKRSLSQDWDLGILDHRLREKKLFATENGAHKQEEFPAQCQALTMVYNIRHTFSSNPEVVRLACLFVCVDALRPSQKFAAFFLFYLG